VSRFLVLSLTKNSIETGQTSAVSAQIADGNGSPISSASATYSTTTPNVISISGNVITGLSPGIGRIIGTSGSLSGAINVNVTAPAGGGGGDGEGGNNGLTLTPESVEKLPGGTQQFTVTGGAGTYTWSVNGIPNGNSTYGTVTATGFYTAPAAVPTPSKFQLCAAQASPALSGCASVTISQVPTGGADVIIINDLNLWDNTYGAPVAGNVQFWKNTATFTASGPRATQTGYLIDVSRSPACYPGYCTITGGYSVLKSTLESVGMTVTQTATNQPITSIPPNIKVILLVTPRTTFAVSEINVLKNFAAEGGRIIYMGEFEGYFTTSDIAVENDFLAKMGAVAHNGGQNRLCTGTTTLIAPHQITTGVTSIAFACASEMDVLGPNDYALFRDPSTQAVIGAVAKIDLQPLSSNLVPTAVRGMGPRASLVRPSTTVPASPTGVPMDKVKTP